jgi:hypothetical protein
MNDPSRRASAGPAVLATFLIAVVILAGAPDNMRVVLAPMIAGVVIAIGFFSYLSARSAVAPIAEIGVTFVAAVTVYLAVPLAVYLALGQVYTPLNDNRLYQIQPDAAEVAGVGWLYVAFLGSFAAVYLLVRGRAEPVRGRPASVGGERVAFMVSLFFVFSLLFFVFVAPHSSQGYAGGYAAVAALPLAIRQFLKLWEGWSVIITLAVRVWLFQDFSRKKWIIAAWLLYDVLVVALSLGSRTAAAISLVSSVMLYHLYVRPVRVRTAVAGVFLGLTGFLALGLVRAYGGFGGFGGGQLGVGNAGGEFEVLFGNVIDIQHRIASGEISSLPWSLHLADILAPFPSQVLPFQKYDPAAWYVNTFYPEAAESGAGLAFGVIAQGAIGLRWIELVIRGALLGYAFGALHRYFSRNSNRFWVVVLYLWLTVWCYQSFRNQSFILLTYILQWFITLVLVVEGGIRVLRGGGISRAAPASNAPISAGGVSD